MHSSKLAWRCDTREKIRRAIYLRLSCGRFCAYLGGAGALDFPGGMSYALCNDFLRQLSLQRARVFMKPELVIQIPPLQQALQRELQVQARQGDMQAIIILRPYYTPGDYLWEHYWDRVNTNIRRKLTPGQDERGLALFWLLRERFIEALLAAGWQDTGQRYDGRPIWHYGGPATSEQQRTQPREGMRATPQAKSASVTRPHLRNQEVPALSPTPPESQNAPAPQVLTSLDPNQAQPARKRIEVPLATKPRAAYQRTISTRLVTFTCVKCGAVITEQRFPGPSPRYCSEACKQEAGQAATLARVQRFRARQRAENKDQQ